MPLNLIKEEKSRAIYCPACGKPVLVLQKHTREITIGCLTPYCPLKTDWRHRLDFAAGDWGAMSADLLLKTVEDSGGEREDLLEKRKGVDND